MRRILLLRHAAVFLLRPARMGTGIKAVSGTIKDVNGQLLPRRNSYGKGTQNGTVTVADGSFKISADPSGHWAFTFMGYAQQEVPASSASFDIILKERFKESQ